MNNETLYTHIAKLINAARNADNDPYKLQKFTWALAQLKGDNPHTAAFPNIDVLKAINIAADWHADPLIQAYKGLLKSCSKLIEPSREEMARELVTKAKEYNCSGKDRVAQMKLAAEVMGFIKPNGKHNPDLK